MKLTRPCELFCELAKKNVKQRGKLLGLDVGDKYVGIALSDTKKKIASPLSVLVRTNSNIDLVVTDFQTLISKLSIHGIVVGYPFDRLKESAAAVQVNVFVDELSKTGKLEDTKYTYWNECFTSKDVSLMSKNLNIPASVSKTLCDKYAAVGILQGYLDYMNKKMKLAATKNSIEVSSDHDHRVISWV
ncbi:hypothetical protein ACFE04_028805 [Oxalis oulophora]